MPESKVILPSPRQTFLDSNGRPLAGAKLFTYEPGTTTKRTTWTDSSGLTPNTNPIILDANGQCDIWIERLAPFEVQALPPGPPGPPGLPGVTGPPGATGNTAEFSNTVDIPSATIFNAFYGQYLELVPAQGDGIVIVPVGVAINFHYATTPYDSASGNFVLNWGPPLFPTPVPNGSFTGAVLDGVTDKVVFLPKLDGLAGATENAYDIANAPLTLTFDAAIVQAPLIAIYVAAPGSGYAVDDEFDIAGGDGNATGKVTAETAGVPTAVEIILGGTAYSSDLGVATTATSGAGSGLTLDTTSAENQAGSLRVTTFYRKLNLIPA